MSASQEYVDVKPAEGIEVDAADPTPTCVIRHPPSFAQTMRPDRVATSYYDIKTGQKCTLGEKAHEVVLALVAYNLSLDFASEYVILNPLPGTPINCL